MPTDFDPLARQWPPRLTPLAATRCYGGGGGGSADQTQTQQQTTITTQQGVSDQGAGAFGEGSTAISITQDTSADSITAGLQAAADISQNAGNVAYWTAHDASQAAAGMAHDATQAAADMAQNAGNVAYWTAHDAQDTAKQFGNVAYWLADAGLTTAQNLGGGAFDLARETNAQNTGLLARLATLFTGATADTMRSAANFGASVAGDALDLAKDSNAQLAQTYRFNADRTAAMYENSLAGIESLAKSTTTGGQTETNKSFVWIVGIFAAVLVLPALFRRA